MTIRKLNKILRDRYDDCKNIVHDRDGRTYLTTSAMPNTNQAGRIFVGYTDELLSMAERGEL